MTHVRKTLVALCAIVALSAAVTACEVPDEKGTAADRTDTKGAANSKAKTADKAKAGKTKTEVKETSGQANAREAAANYLDFTGFSHKGLVKQLVFEGYSQKDAEYGVKAQHADFKKQAALSAKNYLDVSSFSRSGLITQLKFDGYTQEEAEAGVETVGLK